MIKAITDIPFELDVEELSQEMHIEPGSDDVNSAIEKTVLGGVLLSTGNCGNS